MKVVIVVLMAAAVSACATPAPVLPMEASEMSPGVYLLMKGTQRQMEDIPTASKAMLLAGEFCAKQNQAPELILGAEGELRYMAFRCVSGDVWPPKQ